MTARRRDRREKSFSGVSAFQSMVPSFNPMHQSSLTFAPDELTPLVRSLRRLFPCLIKVFFQTNPSQTLDPYQSSVEYRLQELTK